MPTISDQAVVLGRLDYSETSQVIILFTREHGKVRAIARGIKRGTKTRFAAGIDLLDIGDVVFSSRHERSESLATVTEWRQRRSLPGLREKLVRIHAGQYAAEITGQLTEDWDPHVELFDGLLAHLVELSECSDPFIPVVTYQLSLLKAIGSLPRFDACVACNRVEDLTHFSSFAGGMICRHCESVQVEKREVSRAARNFLASYTLHQPVLIGVPGTDQQPDESALIGVFDVLDYHLAHLMGKQARLAEKLVPRDRRRRL